MNTYPSFVVALPDCATESSVADALELNSDTVYAHPSGRPWLYVKPGPRRVISTREGFAGMRIVLVGPSSASEQDLARVSLISRTAIEALSHLKSFDGSYLTFVSDGETALASGPAMEAQRIFMTDIGGQQVVADRSDILADLGSRDLDAAIVALQMVPSIPHPFRDRSVWQGISMVSGEDYVAINRHGRLAGHDRWWSDPAPVQSRADGAAQLRESLRNAVRTRVSDTDLVTVDLSGGLDSTSVCYFAADLSPGRVIASTYYTDDPGGREDLDWAIKSLQNMPGVKRHDVQSGTTLPDYFGGLADLGLHIDEPSQVPAAAPRLLHMLHDDEKIGSSVHMTGIGGDHLFRSVPAWDHSIAQRHPRLAWQRARAEHVTQGVSRMATLRQLRDRRRYGTWLQDTVRAARDTPTGFQMPSIGDWAAPVTFPSWMAADAVDQVASMLLDDVESIEPQAEDRARNFDMYTLREAGKLARAMAVIGFPLDKSLDSPLVDDNVAAAALSVRYEDRDTPLEWKPLIKSAMSGLLPDDYLRRTTKIGGGAQAVRGYAAHYGTLEAIWDESGILDMGLVDRARFIQEAQPSPNKAPGPYIMHLTNLALFLRDTNQRPRLKRPTFDSRSTA